MIWINILFGLLSLLLQWWMKKKEAGAPPSARDIRNTNHVIAMVEKIKALAVPMGCAPEGEIDQFEPPALMTATPESAEWFPGKNILLNLAPQLIEELGLPWAREMASKLPIPINYNDSDLKAFLLDTLTKSQT